MRAAAPRCTALVPRTTLVGDSSLAVGEAWPPLHDSLAWVVRRWTPDKDVRRDLLQEALIKLWMVDPTRFDLRDPDEFRYLRRLLLRRMRRVFDGVRRDSRWYREVDDVPAGPVG